MAIYRSIGTLRQLIGDIDWPIDFFSVEDLPSFLDKIYVVDYDFNTIPSGFAATFWLAFEGELSIKIPGLEGTKLVVGSNMPDFTFVTVTLKVTNDIILTFSNIRIALRFDPNILKPAAIDDGEAASQFAEIQIEGSISVNLKTFDVIIEGAEGFRLTPAMIGDSGIIISAEDVKIDLSRTTSPPEIIIAGFDPGFIGVFMGEAKVKLPSGMNELVPSDLIIHNCIIGSGGVSGGPLVAHYDPIYDENSKTFTGNGAGELLGIPFGLHDVKLTFKQNSLQESQISGELLLPFFDKRFSVEIGINLNGGFAVKLIGAVEQGDSFDSSTGLINLHKEPVLDLRVDSIGFEVKDNIFTTKISGLITPLPNVLRGPGFQVKELTIDSQGNVHLEGGWLDLPKQYSVDFHGFQMEITKMGFGKTEDAGKWIGFSGSIKLVDGLPAGISVEGLRIIWYDDGSTNITFNGVGVEFEIPGAFSFKGAVAYHELPNNIHRFDGKIKLELTSLDLELEGTLVFGIDRRPNIDRGTNFFAIYISTELPAGIPLFATGVGLYGFAGLFADQMEPDKGNDEGWYENLDGSPGWYKRGPEVGVTDLANKWVPSPGSFAFGAGVTIGTIADNGYVFNGRMLLAIVFPGPILLIEGKANLLTERSKLSDRDDPLFRALVVLDNRAGTFLARLDARFKYGGGGELIDIYGNAEAFFDFNDASAWYLYLGRKEPRNRRIRASVFYHIFEANSYFMLDAKQIATGAWIGINEQWIFGPLGVTLEAWIEGNAILSWKPAHFHGDLWLHGKAELEVWVFGIGLTVDARFATDVFDPFHILAELCVGIDLPWFLPDFDVCIGFEWGPEPNTPEVSLPVQEIAIEHPKNSTTWPLPRKEVAVPNEPPDPPNVPQNFPPQLLPDYDRDNNGFRDSSDLTQPDPSTLESLVPEKLQVVPLDCRPTITFSRPVNNDISIGVPSYVQGPSTDIIERIGDPSKNGGPFSIRYGLGLRESPFLDLKEIALYKWIDGSATPSWRLIARKGLDGNPAGVEELYGAWAPVPNMPDGGGKFTANVKLSLWTQSTFDYTRHTGSAWYEWFTNRFTDYPCVPIPPDVEICYDFKDITPYQQLQSPFLHPDQPGLILSWILPIIQYVTVLEEPVEGLTHALCFPTKENEVRIDLPAPAKRIRIVLVDEQGVSVEARDILGNSHYFYVRPGDHHIEIALRDLITVILSRGYRTCILQICITTGPDPSDIERRLEMNEHLRDELAHWYHQDHVLEPHSVYRLKVVTAIRGVGEGMLAGRTLDYTQREFAYFSTEGPPGLANLSLPIGITNRNEVTLFDENKRPITVDGLPATRRVFKSELNSLVPYVTQTVPSTVPGIGQKPPLLRPIYRAYDVGVEFNENYVELMYRMERRDLGLYLYDSNNRPIRDAQGRLIIINNMWGKTEDLRLTETENQWVITVNGNQNGCGNINVSMIPHSSTLSSLAEGQVLEPDYVYEARFTPLLLHETFDNLPLNTVFAGPAGVIDGWNIRDSGQINGPSTWEVRQVGDPPSRYIIQTSEIAGGSTMPSNPNKPGTMLIRRDSDSLSIDHPDQPSRWTDYRFSVYVRSDYVGIIGITFRNIDYANYYLFAMDYKNSTRRLSKVIDGRYTILAEDNFSYSTEQDYLITVEAIGNLLGIYQDGKSVFTKSDNSISRGTVGLYCWSNSAARFSDIRVDDFREVAPVVYRFKFTTSIYATFCHQIHSYQDETWSVDLSSTIPNAPANEEIFGLISNAVQLSNTMAIFPPPHQEVTAYDSLAMFVIGQDSRQVPKELQVMKVELEGKPFALFVWSPEPIDWARTTLKLMHTRRLSTFSELPLQIKLTDVSFGSNQPNEESVTLLLRKATSLAGYSIEYRVPAGAIAETVGNPVKLVDEFDEIKSGLLFREDFGPNSMDHYTIINEGENEGPSNWYVHNDMSIRQSSRIYGGTILCEELEKPGTMAVTGNKSWRNIRINSVLRSLNVAGAAIGLVFRYKDEKNCYLLSFDRQCGYRRLVKRTNGSTKLLWHDKNDNSPVMSDRSYRLVIEVFEDKILGYLDDALLFSIRDDDGNGILSSGLVGFYCWKNDYAQFEGLSVESLESSPLLWQPTFENLNEVHIVDEPGANEPSNWSTEGGVLVQSSSIKVEDNTAYQPGTFALAGSERWDDIEISARIRSDDEGAIGIMFRVSPDTSYGNGEEKINYYRFSMDRRQAYWRLIKKVGDSVTVLWPQAPEVFQYVVGQNYELTLRMIGNQIQGFIDGILLFTVFDSDLKRGNIGLYCRDNAGARFERVVVTDWVRRVGQWTIKDEGVVGAPSVWRISNNSLNQLSEINGDGGGPAYPGTYVTAGSENWDDYRLEVGLRSDTDRAIGIIFRYTDENNDYYRLSFDNQLNYSRLIRNKDGIMTPLWEDLARSYTTRQSFTVTVDVIGPRLVGYMDGERLFDVTDSANSRGKIGLYCWGNSGARFEHVEVRRPPLDAYALFQDRFSRDDTTGFTFVNEGTLLGPSVWNTYEGTLRQTSGIYSPQTDGDSLSEKGTYALFGSSEWTDVIISVRLKSFATISGLMGLMFRYRGPDDYYRISMDSSLQRLRLVKNFGGIFTLLWEDTITYARRRGSELTVVVSQSNIRCFFDGIPVFVVEDSDLTHGSAGLYCARNTDARFSDVRVYPIDLAFNNWILSEQFESAIVDNQWKKKDDGDQEGPSEWNVIEGELRQTSNIHSIDPADDDNSDAAKLGTYVVTGSSSWTDYRLIVRLISDDANGAIGVQFRCQDADADAEDSYYRFSMHSSMDSQLSYHRLIKKFRDKIKVLWENAKPFTVGREYLITIDCNGDRLIGYLDGIQLFDVEDQDLLKGSIGLYCWKNTGARFLSVYVAEPIWTNYYTFRHREPKLPDGSRVRLYAGRRPINQPTEEDNTVKKYIASLDENGRLRIPKKGVDLRVVESTGEIVHARHFLPEEEYVEIDNTQILRKADGTGFFLVFQNLDSPLGSELMPGQYRLSMNYNRDNSIAFPESQVLKQAGNKNPEKVIIDIPWNSVSEL
jgi:hypothetical protein